MTEFDAEGSVHRAVRELSTHGGGVWAAMGGSVHGGSVHGMRTAAGDVEMGLARPSGGVPGAGPAPAAFGGLRRVSVSQGIVRVDAADSLTAVTGAWGGAGRGGGAESVLDELVKRESSAVCDLCDIFQADWTLDTHMFLNPPRLPAPACRPAPGPPPGPTGAPLHLHPGRQRRHRPGAGQLFFVRSASNSLKLGCLQLLNACAISMPGSLLSVPQPAPNLPLPACFSQPQSRASTGRQRSLPPHLLGRRSVGGHSTITVAVPLSPEQAGAEAGAVVPVRASEWRPGQERDGGWGEAHSVRGP